MLDQPPINNKNAPHPSRKSPRLAAYDYSATGYYFVTICIREQQCLLGEIVEDTVRLNSAGQMVASAWMALAERFEQVDLDLFVVMPNHVHGIIILKNGIGVGADLVSARLCISRVIQAFKSTSTNKYIRGVNQEGWNKFDQTLWQRSFYDHVIRNDQDLSRIQEYILNNPLQWALDDENPNRKNQLNSGRTQGPPLRIIFLLPN
jgi:REP element-mobilizing transposase RayT